MQNSECNRLCLNDGQFFSTYKFKNVQWYLNGKRIGFGDLRTIDIIHIGEALTEGEIFEAFNEHHMTPWMQRESPMVRIEHNATTYPDRAPVSEETRAMLRDMS